MTTKPRIGRVGGVLLQVAAGGVVTIALLLVAEGMARMIVGAPLARPASVPTAPNRDYVATTLAVLELAPGLNPSPLVQDAYVLWRNKPEARKTQPVNPEIAGRPATWTIENNSEGYRGPERTPAAAGVYRVVCVGDSVTFGFNVDQPDAYPRRLEALLRARHPGRAIEVVNTGVPGWTWVQGLRFLEHEGLALHPDLVIAAHGTNDQFWPALVTDRERLPVNGAPAPEMRPPTLLERTSLHRLAQRMRGRPEPAPEASARCRAEIERAGSCKRVPLAEIEATVREMSRRVRDAGSDFVVLNLDFMETPAVEGVRVAVAADGVTFVDFVDQFRRLEAAEQRALEERFGVRPAVRAEVAPAGAMQRVLFRVLMDEAAPGPRSVRGNGYWREDVRFEAPLRDDGQDGDDAARDQVWSAVVEVPPDVGAIEYTFWQGETAEFTPLPPLRSRSGARFLRVRGETVAPVAVFAARPRMAERTHPNAEGQALIARALADLVETLPSFRAWRDRL